MVAPLRGGDCRHATRASDRTLGFEPSTQTKKYRAPVGSCIFIGWGRGIRTPVGGVRVRSPTARRSPK